MIGALTLRNPGWLAGLGRLDADARTFLQNAQIDPNAGYYAGTAYEISGHGLWQAVNNLVVAHKDGGAWTPIGLLYPMVGGTAASHKLNLKDPRDLNAAGRLVFTGSPVHSATGVAWNGTTQYAETNVLPTSIMALGSIHLGYYAASNAADPNRSGQGVMGAASTPTADLILVVNRGANQYFVATADAALVSGNTTTAKAGYYFGNRTALNAATLHRNAAQLGQTTTADTGTFTPNMTLKLGIANSSAYSVVPCSFASAGYGLTTAQATAHRNAVIAFQQALNRYHA